MSAHYADATVRAWWGPYPHLQAAINARVDELDGGA